MTDHRLLFTGDLFYAHVLEFLREHGACALVEFSSGEEEDGKFL
jgi:hypothetical protein